MQPIERIVQSIAKIEPHLFLGSCYSLTPEILQEHNITHIFHLGVEIPVATFESDYFRQSCKNEYFELEDNSHNVNEMMQIGDYICQKIKTLMEKATIENILVCCLMGRSRSASMIALYLHSKYPELSYEEIINNRIKPFKKPL
jgi:hypothetical protein